jgi:hypothetical protein
MQWFLHRVVAMSGAAKPHEMMVIIAMMIGDLYTEDEGGVDMEEVPGLYSEDSSSKMLIPSSSPERPQRLVPQLPEDKKSKRTTTTREREDPGVFT